jgi:predicted nucleotidyltransferase
MELDADEVQPRFRGALRALRNLESDRRYLGVFVFGSLARDEAGTDSDVDAQIVVDDGAPCPNLSHPRIDGVKLDLSFPSMERLRRDTAAEIERRERVPMIAESAIIFDRDGSLRRLRLEARRARPRVADAVAVREIRFLLHHEADKVHRHLVDDPAAALLAMTMGVGDLIGLHYRLRGRWMRSSKRLLTDLREWDSELAARLEAFLLAGGGAAERGRHWDRILDHVSVPAGGLSALGDSDCGCTRCRADVEYLLSSVQE